jgi:serine/threonine-protein kinase
MGFNIGDTVGDYRVTGILGAGGMGTVYKVQHLISDRIEALKVLLPNLEGNPELAERFLREIKLQAALSHPGIAALLTAFRVTNQLLMVMEYVDGESLDVLMRRGQLELWTGVDLMRQVLAALDYAHKQSVIHRDIKPANIMVTASGVVKLMDFGIARLINDHRITQTGVAVGSLYYMSPEQIKGGQIDERSDIYSVGITLYELATGERPIQGDSSYSVMSAHLQQVPRSPDLLNPRIPPVLALAIMKALQKDRLERYQTAGEFVATLDDIRKRHDPAWATSNRAASYVSAESLPAPPQRPIAQQHVRHEPDAPAWPTPYPPLASNAVTPRTPASTATPTPASGSPHAGTMLFDPDRLERIKRELAAHIGPVARVLVDRTAKKSTSWKQLYDTLAKEVPEGPERDRFLASRSRI